MLATTTVSPGFHDRTSASSVRSVLLTWVSMVTVSLGLTVRTRAGGREGEKEGGSERRPWPWTPFALSASSLPFPTQGNARAT